jgi:hypothetical protein
MVHATTAQVETLLRKYEPVNETQSPSITVATNVALDSEQTPVGLIANYGTSSFSPPSRHCMSDDPQTQAHSIATEISIEKKPDYFVNANFSWEMVELGLEEPLPEQEILEDLYELRLSWGIFPADIRPGLRSTLRKFTPLFP